MSRLMNQCELCGNGVGDDYVSVTTKEGYSVSFCKRCEKKLAKLSEEDLIAYFAVGDFFRRKEVTENEKRQREGTQGEDSARKVPHKPRVLGG